MTEAHTVSHFALNVRVVLSFTANLEIFQGNLGKVLGGSAGNTAFKQLAVSQGGGKLKEYCASS